MQKVAEELGYRPHLAARSLRQSKSRHIGIAFAPVSAPEADLVEAIYPVAAELIPRHNGPDYLYLATMYV